ncbi:MOSC domain-containing protein [Polychaeton citri CBS 116435]|uniref:MOSC domain-containing protein n=1 Tax=Polychaeton citri CBS 116435 TaxID=1314669 RepID=A0A9P4QDJ8_9PEZI|nr:MOSC domain-containing protein [Polychaeton citri CBS 116435]
MKVAKVYTYPIKSLRAFETPSAEVTRHGFAYDRHFMLLKVLRDDDNPSKPSYKNMAVAYFPECVLFFPSILFPPSSTLEDKPQGKIRVDFRPPASSGREARSIEIPLTPDVSGLDEIEVDMHRSPTRGYRMDEDVCKWFSDCFGYEVVLAYLGGNRRGVKMTTSSDVRYTTASAATAPGGFLSSILSKASEAILGCAAEANQQEEITFADCAPYLVVSEKSMDDIHRRLPDNEKMDITKFRPNIIVSGAEKQWEEDYWGEVTFSNDIRMECAQNCARCQSINIDYATGRAGEGEAGKMLKKLQSDRRVDPGMKYSPVFGRYSFLHPSSEGATIKVGDEVAVTRKNEEKTRFDWEGICTK